MNEILEKKVTRAIKLIQSASKLASEHGQPLECCFSGGKDSCVILELCKMANVNFRPIYKNTGIDVPGTIKFCKENNVEIMQPKISFSRCIERSGFPNRFSRHCCAYLKEYKVLDYAILGIRADESTKRKARYKEPERCRVYNKKEKTRQYFPILDWTKEDVLAFIKERNIQLHPLYYDERGNIDMDKRLGCMCCPMANRKERIKHFKHWPNMVKFYIRYGKKYMERHPNAKWVKLFHGNVYENFCFDLFCNSYVEFKERFCGENLFGEKIDCKKFLEDYFKIKFKD